MVVGIVGISREASANILLCMSIRWPDLETSYLKSAKQASDVHIMLVGGDVLTLPEQTREVRRTFDGALVGFSKEPSIEEMVATLSGGADDYLPFTASAPEIVWRIFAAMRRSGSAKPETDSARAGKLYLNLQTFEALLGEKPISLTPTEFRILYHLLKQKGRVVTHQALLELTWGSQGPSYHGALRKYVQRLRVKLKASNGAVAIATVARVGYRLLEAD